MALSLLLVVTTRMNNASNSVISSQFNQKGTAMFSNTVRLKANVSDVTTSIIDGPANQRTVRASGDGIHELTIAHQGSNENSGFTTQRSNVRVTRKIALDDTDRTLKAYVQITSSFPKDHMSAAELQDLFGLLLSFVLYSENDEGGAADAAGEGSAVSRLYAGEP